MSVMVMVIHAVVTVDGLVHAQHSRHVTHQRRQVSAHASE